MKIAIFHELTPLSGARKVAEEYGKILSKENIVDLYYASDTEDKNVKAFFNQTFFFKFKGKKWNGANWKVKLYKDSLELIKLYFLHKKIAAHIKEGNYNLILINPSRFTQAPFLLRFVRNSVYFCQEPLRLVYDDLFKLGKELGISRKIYESLNRFVRKWVDKDNISNAKVILANSKFSKNNIKKAYGIEAIVCYLGVDPNLFAPLNLEKIYDLVFVGVKEDIEGYDLLKSTLNLYKNPLAVEFVSRNENGQDISDSDLIKKINKSKIILTLSQNEPFGLTAIEAMACGIPVIAVDEGGFRESVINNKTGYLIKRDKDELKKRIDTLLDNDNLRGKMGKAGRNLIEKKFTWEISVNNFLRIVSKNI